MQTIKTSSIVVLLLTVMYGGYVSLTTPPEPIPPEVADLLQFEDDLGIDTGMASNATEMGVQASFPEARIANGADQTQPQPNRQNPPSRQNAPGSNPPASMSLGNPQGDPPLPSPPGSFRAQNSAASSTMGASFAGLPSASTPAKTVSLDMSKPFPATAGSFQLPTPSSAQENFDPQTGHSFDMPQSGAPTNAAASDPSMPSMDRAQTEMTKQVSVSFDSSGGNKQVASPNSPSATNNVGLANAFETADRQYGNDQMREALATLSVFYGTPNLPVAQRSSLLSRLDPLAREVIYSPRHLLDKPHRVGANETLMEIAQKYRVPWQLLANINGIKDPLVITPGTELKIVPGPFNAQVDIAKRELTIFLGDLYAGRFPIAVGSDPVPKPGTFTVQDKQSQRVFYDRSGAPIPAGDPANPYGNAWIDLGSQLCIHGSPEAETPTSKGCISLAGNFADDLFGILSQGSSVTIR